MTSTVDQAIPERLPTGGLSADNGRKTAFVTVLIWIGLCMLYVVLLKNNSLVNKPESAMLYNSLTILISYTPLILASAALAIAFARKPEWMLSPFGLVCTGAVFLLGVLLLMETATMLVVMWIKDQPFAEFFTKLRTRGIFIWWMHSCIIVLAFVAQAAYASLRRTQAQEQAWQQEQTEKLALRLRLLQGQLKPHFLFNALNSISALVRTADRTLACNALQKLRDLLRYAVHASKQEWLTVADEAGFIRDYLDLQMLRYGDRLTLDWQIAPLAWDRLACPPLLLQPLVENAIHHGVENHHERCRIQVRLEHDHRNVRLVLENPLIDAKRAQKNHQGHGVGLSATRERLRLLYQDEAQLSTTIDHARQVVVTTLQFPARAYREC